MRHIVSVRLPPLPALRVFESAGRHGNFSRAPEELHLTHGAISHQIKSLEHSLGTVLFRRGRRGVSLTSQGAAFAAVLHDALDRIARGVAALRGPRALTVSVLPAFATHWLIPRLADFQARHPDIDVNIRANQQLVDFTQDDVDLAIRYGPGSWPGLSATQLLSEHVFAVCSPHFAGGRLPRNLPELAAAALLHSPAQPWEAWFRAVGANPPAHRRGPSFSETGLVLRAAIDGLGIALARSVLVQPELDSGLLVRVLPHSVPAAFAYYLVRPENAEISPNLAVLCEWLQAQAASQAHSATRDRATPPTPPHARNRASGDAAARLAALRGESRSR
jgi:LysR family transcriptional regulator, glycine cleavage system transcriptional activator